MQKYMILLINSICDLGQTLKAIGNGVFDPGYSPTRETVTRMIEMWKNHRGCQVVIIGLSDYNPVISLADEAIFRRLIDGMNFEKDKEQQLLDEFQQGLWSGLLIAHTIQEVIPGFPIVIVSERHDYEISQICLTLGFRFVEIPIDNEDLQRTIGVAVMQAK